MIASFGNSTLVSRVNFPKVAIMTRGNPKYWASGRGLADWQRHPSTPHAKPGPQDQPPFPPSRCNGTRSHLRHIQSQVITQSRLTSKSRLSHPDPPSRSSASPPTCPNLEHYETFSSKLPTEEPTRQGMCISSTSG